MIELVQAYRAEWGRLLAALAFAICVVLFIAGLAGVEPAQVAAPIRFALSLRPASVSGTDR